MLFYKHIITHGTTQATETTVERRLIRRSTKNCDLRVPTHLIRSKEYILKL